MNNKIILLGNIEESKRLNSLLCLLKKHRFNYLTYDSTGIAINERKVKANPFDNILFHDLVIAAGIDPKCKTPESKQFCLYCDGILNNYRIAYINYHVVLTLLD